MSSKKQENPIHYQRGKTTITGTGKQVSFFIGFDLISSKIIKLFRLPAIGIGLEELVRWYLHYH